MAAGAPPAPRPFSLHGRKASGPRREGLPSPNRPPCRHLEARPAPGALGKDGRTAQLAQADPPTNRHRCQPGPRHPLQPQVMSQLSLTNRSWSARGGPSRTQPPGAPVPGETSENRRSARGSRPLEARSRGLLTKGPGSSSLGNSASPPYLLDFSSWLEDRNRFPSFLGTPWTPLHVG